MQARRFAVVCDHSPSARHRASGMGISSHEMPPKALRPCSVMVKYMRRKHNLLVGERTAEEMKKQIGCVFPKDEEETMDVKGRCLLTGLPKVVTVSSTEMMDAFEEPVERIMEAIHSVLERTPPELVADISTNGIVMTGGGSLVSGFDKLVTARTGIHTVIADDAISCVALGTGKSLDSLNSMQDGTMNLSRRKQMN